MSNNKEIKDLALMKLLMDPRRLRILELAEKEPMSVGQMAERLGELPSRVYYHVHKLEEAGLLELVETRQHGNLLEKYYRCTEVNIAFKLDPTFISQNLRSVRKEMERVLSAGLQMLEYKMANGQTGTDENASALPRVRMKASWESMTESEWVHKIDKMTVNDELTAAPAKGHPAKPGGEKGDYAFIVLSYSLEDAQRLGFYTPPDEEDEKA